MAESASVAEARRRGSAIVAFGLATAATLPVGYLAMFSSFAPWDDEGYVLLTLRSYAHGGRLYDEIYSQYGPLFYEIVSGVFHALDLPYTHDAGRLVTLGVWLATSLLCGVASFWMTRRVLLGLGVQLLVFQRLTSLCNEPLHPGGLLCLLLGVMIAAVSFEEAPGAGAMALVGSVVAAMLLVKINVGVFALVSLTLVVAWAVPDRPGLLAAKVLVTLGALAAPTLLMWGRIAAPMVQRYAAQVSLAALAVVITFALARERPRLEPRQLAGL